MQVIEDAPAGRSVKLPHLLGLQPGDTATSKIKQARRPPSSLRLFLRCLSFCCILQLTLACT